MNVHLRHASTCSFGHREAREHPIQNDQPRATECSTMSAASGGCVEAGTAQDAAPMRVASACSQGECRSTRIAHHENQLRVP